MITIASENAELTLAPKNGGCVSAFRWRGQDILRPFDPAVGPNASATDYAAFPLFPFSGRIANGRFSFGGKAYHLPPNFPPEPHAIHGQGWQSEWDVTDHGENHEHYQQHRILNNENITIQHRSYEITPHSWPSENGLRQNRSSEQ